MESGAAGWVGWGPARSPRDEVRTDDRSPGFAHGGLPALAADVGAEDGLGEDYGGLLARRARPPPGGARGARGRWVHGEEGPRRLVHGCVRHPRPDPWPGRGSALRAHSRVQKSIVELGERGSFECPQEHGRVRLSVAPAFGTGADFGRRQSLRPSSGRARPEIRSSAVIGATNEEHGPRRRRFSLRCRSDARSGLPE